MLFITKQRHETQLAKITIVANYFADSWLRTFGISCSISKMSIDIILCSKKQVGVNVCVFPRALTKSKFYFVEMFQNCFRDENQLKKLQSQHHTEKVQ